MATVSPPVGSIEPNSPVQRHFQRVWSDYNQYPEMQGIPAVLRHWAETSQAHLVATSGATAPVYVPSEAELCAERRSEELDRKVARLERIAADATERAAEATREAAEWKRRYDQVSGRCRALEQELDYRELFQDTVPFDRDVDLDEPQPN